MEVKMQVLVDLYYVVAVGKCIVWWTFHVRLWVISVTIIVIIVVLLLVVTSLIVTSLVVVLTLLVAIVLVIVSCI